MKNLESNNLEYNKDEVNLFDNPKNLTAQQITTAIQKSFEELEDFVGMEKIKEIKTEGKEIEFEVDVLGNKVKCIITVDTPKSKAVFTTKTDSTKISGRIEFVKNEIEKIFNNSD